MDHGVAHEVPRLITQLSIILLAAKVSGEISERFFKAPGVLGELAAGIIIGPYALGGVVLPFCLGIWATCLLPAIWLARPLATSHRTGTTL